MLCSLLFYFFLIIIVCMHRQCVCGQTMPAKAPSEYLRLCVYYGVVFFLSIAEKGIRLVNEGQYSEAVNMFTEAIRCDPKDYRYHHSTLTANTHYFTSLILNCTLLFVLWQVFWEPLILLLLSGSVLSSTC